jgi:DNA-binding CsgD family transcriptional regulator
VIQEDNMFELTTLRPEAQGRPGPVAPHSTHAPGSVPMGRLLARALDEVDYGILLLSAEGDALHLNHRARQWLDGNPALQLLGQRVRARDPRDVALLHDALIGAAQRGLRRLLALGRGDARQVAALVPVEPGVAALVLGKSSVCEDLSLQCFARSHDLTPAETRVLVALGQGVKPSRIAADQGVKLSTVRTQIGAIRSKTGVDSIGALLRLVASLPPMVGVLRR